VSVFPLTSSQTVGPFFSIGLLSEDATRNVLTQQETEGLRIRIIGRILDGDGVPVPDALVEIWQANASGRYNHPADQSNLPLDPHFSGFGRAGTNAQGEYWFETIKPGSVPVADGQWQAPHICVTIFARGLLNHLCTRLYFADEPANAQDAILQCVPAERQATLLANRTDEGDQVVYRFDIILQGENETVFLNIR
jgi:protocatechuate 3,4-dioxygenase alpha subunit